MNNEMFLEFDAVSSNEGFARVAVAAFISPLNPTLEEISDVKTAVSEAVTNAIIHGYENLNGYGKGKTEMEKNRSRDKRQRDKVWLRCRITGDVLHIEVEDKGKGIENIEQAMEPLFTTKPELERSGMGFAFMEAFMDDLEVESVPGEGTKILMKKKISAGPWIVDEE